MPDRNKPSSRPIGVTHVIGILAIGGAERFVTTLLPTLARKHNVVPRLIVLSSRTDRLGQSMRRAVADAGIHIQIGPTERIGLQTIRWYRRSLSRMPSDIVHLHTPNTELMHYLGTWPKRRQLICRTLHSTRPPSGWITRVAYQCNTAALSIACSAAVAASHSRMALGKMITISNGIDLPATTSSPQDRMLARAELDFSPDAIHFLQVGRMAGSQLTDNPKAQDITIRAWHLADMKAKSCHLHLVGDGPLREQLEHLSKGDPSIHFHGVQSEVQTYLLAADRFVMPSRYEGLPLAAIEAACNGLVCILSDISPMRELSIKDATYCSAGDAQSLAAALSRMADTTIRSGNTLDAEPMRDRFSMERTADEYYAQYRMLVNGST